jgi:hypothetical protein
MHILKIELRDSGEFGMSVFCYFWHVVEQFCWCRALFDWSPKLCCESQNVVHRVSPGRVTQYMLWIITHLSFHALRSWEFWTRNCVRDFRLPPSSIFWVVTLVRYSQTFRDNLSVPSSVIKQSNKSCLRGLLGLWRCDGQVVPKRLSTLLA